MACIPINTTLYRLLVQRGAPEAEAAEAARVDQSPLATTADLAAFKAEVLKWTIGIVVTAMSLQTALLVFLFSQLTR